MTNRSPTTALRNRPKKEEAAANAFSHNVQQQDHHCNRNNNNNNRMTATSVESSAGIPYDRLPFPREQVNDFLRRACLSRLMENYEQPSQMYLSNKPEGRVKLYCQLRDRDILNGRGTTVNNHPGNVLMRCAIAINQGVYEKLDRGRKKIAADSLIAYFESWDIRFLEMMESKKGGDKSKKYYPCTYAKACEKVMQALRDKISRKIQVPPADGDTGKTAMVSNTQKDGKLKPCLEMSVALGLIGLKKASIKKSSRTKGGSGSAPSTPKKRPTRHSCSTDATDLTDHSPRAVTDDTTATTFVMEGTFDRPIAAPVMSLASFLRGKIQQN